MISPFAPVHLPTLNKDQINTDVGGDYFDDSDPSEPKRKNQKVRDRNSEERDLYKQRPIETAERSGYNSGQNGRHNSNQEDSP